MELKENHIKFREEIDRRGINYLVHFTPTINLLSIYEQKKLLSRSLLEQFDISQTDIFDYVEFPDSIRFDDKRFINLSIEHPNTFLFNRFRERTKDMAHIRWCVLKINPQCIYFADTLFSVTNAANSYNRQNVGISGDLEKFKMLFAPSIKIVTSYNSRIATRNKLKKKYTTDEQAEVLVKDQIQLCDFISICFNNADDLAETKAALNAFDTSKFVIDSGLFKNSRE